MGILCVSNNDFSVSSFYLRMPFTYMYRKCCPGDEAVPRMVWSFVYNSPTWYSRTRLPGIGTSQPSTNKHGWRLKLDVWWERVRVGGTWLVLLRGRVAQPNALWKGSMGQALNPKRFQRPTDCVMFRSKTRRSILEILCVCKPHIRKSH